MYFQTNGITLLHKALDTIVWSVFFILAHAVEDSKA